MESGDTLQSAAGGLEYIPRYSYLSVLKHQAPGVANWPPPNLDKTYLEDIPTFEGRRVRVHAHPRNGPRNWKKARKAPDGGAHARGVGLRFIDPGKPV